VGSRCCSTEPRRLLLSMGELYSSGDTRLGQCPCSNQCSGIRGIADVRRGRRC
jgi:hypothetical protein